MAFVKKKSPTAAKGMKTSAPIGGKMMKTRTRTAKPASAGTVRNNTVGRTGSDIKGVSGGGMKMMKTRKKIGG